MATLSDVTVINRHRLRVLLGSVGTVGLVATAVLPAAAADAAPAGAWWFGNMSLAKSQRISTGSGVTVAVLDTGVQADLGDLRGQVLSGISFVGGSATVDVPSSKDKYAGHGTAMASYIAGTGRGAGMVGVAPGAKILPIRDGTNDGINDQATEKGLIWATQHGAKVINVSSAGQSSCPGAMQEAVDYAVRHDVIVVAGTGNTPSIPVGFPANCVGVIAVGGLAYSSSFRPWSGGTVGPQLDFVAPAEHMPQLLLDNTLSNPDGEGTSNATALVSGVFALLRAHFPKESARQIVTRALWNVHNGLGGKVFAKRINNSLGYGEILPNFALTDAPPSNATNPIYDEIDKHLDTGGSTGASGSASAPSSSAAASPAPASSQPAAAADDGSGGPSPAVIAVIAVVVLLIVGFVFRFVARSRRRAPGMR